MKVQKMTLCISKLVGGHINEKAGSGRSSKPRLQEVISTIDDISELVAAISIPWSNEESFVLVV